LQELLDHHQSGRRDYSSSLWTLVMFDAFLRNVADTTAAPQLAARAA
jgi:asparagine synthase (glutamine-hydrolysing)